MSRHGTKGIGFTVYGEPVGKGRPRLSTAGGYARAYTPEKTRNYELAVKACYNQSSEGKFFGKTLHGITVYIKAFYGLPKSLSGTKRREKVLRERPQKKPDCDNVAKVILDALNGVAYKDDAEVTEIRVRKQWTESNPRVEVMLIGEYELLLRLLKVEIFNSHIQECILTFCA